MAKWSDYHTPTAIIAQSDGTLSQKAKNLILKWHKERQEVIKTPWEVTFLNIAKEVATRSPDSQTSVGAVIVNPHKHIMSVGYNGNMSGIDDTILPNTRPDKYPFVLHAEINAILSCEHKPKGCTLYCTHHPCLPCFQCIVQSGITRIVYIAENHSRLTSADDPELEIAIWLVKDRVQMVPYTLESK